MIDDLNDIIIPRYGTYLIEPEARLGDPKYISEDGYFRLRNSLVRKIKTKKEIKYWTLVGKRLYFKHLKKDGVHLGKEGIRKFKEIIENYLIENIKNCKSGATTKEKQQKNKKRPQPKINLKRNHRVPEPSTSKGNTQEVKKRHRDKKGKSKKTKYEQQEYLTERKTKEENYRYRTVRYKEKLD